MQRGYLSDVDERRVFDVGAKLDRCTDLHVYGVDGVSAHIMTGFIASFTSLTRLTVSFPNIGMVDHLRTLMGKSETASPNIQDVVVCSCEVDMRVLAVLFCFGKPARLHTKSLTFDTCIYRHDPKFETYWKVLEQCSALQYVYVRDAPASPSLLRPIVPPSVQLVIMK